MTGLLYSLLVLGLAVFAAVLVLRRAAVWRVGRAADIDWISGIKALPGRYLHDVHDVVARDKMIARMHALAAGGLLAGTIIGAVAGLLGSWFLWGLSGIFFAVALLGGRMVRDRRFPIKPTHLSGGRFQHLPFLLIAYCAGGLFVSAAEVTEIELLAPFGLALATFGGAGLVAMLSGGPMRHAVAGALHLIVHPRPRRFGGGRDTALAPLNLDADRLGIETPADFEWNRLVGFDACIQCGRCELACPAFAAGQPLNPKALIQDLVAAQSGGAEYSGSPHPNARPVERNGGANQPIVGLEAIIHPDTIWSCTTCRACVEECPMMIEHVDAIVGLRRFQLMERAAIPEKAATPLTELRYGGDTGGRNPAARLDFAAGIPLRVLAEEEETDILLWLGEGAYELRYGRTLRALLRLLQAAKLDIAVLGAEERDCGDLARRLGDEATFQALARQNIATLATRRFRRIVTADPHALHVLRNEYPAFGGTYEVIHHAALLDQLVADGRITLGSLGGVGVTYHDPCYLGRYNGEIEAPRRLLDRLGLDRHEMARSGKRSMCCGGGGGAPVGDVQGDRRIPDLRMEQVIETGATIVAVACPQCTAMLEGVTTPRPVVKDIAELVLDAMEAAR